MAGMPIYSQVVPKSHKSKNAGKKERPQNLPREFDPLNYNHGGNFQMLNPPLEGRVEKTEKKEGRRKEESSRTRKQKSDNDGKVEAYLRQNQASMRQRHSAVKQAEHRMNLRSLPLNEVATSRGQDRTPTERRLFPGERDGNKEHRRERERDRENMEFDASPLSPREKPSNRPIRKSSSAHKVTEPAIATDKRRFFCREWAFQKIAHCLEQRPVSKTCGALILGDAGSGKTALCQELSTPQQTAQARQQRALNRRLLARHFLQGNTESSLRPDEFIRSLAMQILSHGLTKQGSERRSEQGHDVPDSHRRNSEEERLATRFRDLSGDDGEESSKPLLADSEDQRTDEEDAGPCKKTSQANPRATMQRIHEKEAYQDAIQDNEVPEILPRSSLQPTNPFLTDDQKDEFRLYENHENLFLRNVSQRQSKEIRNSRLIRQSSEPLSDKKPSVLQKSLSTEQKNDEDRKVENSPPKSRIPVANFRYPNKNEPKLLSVENSPVKKQESTQDGSEEKHEVTDDGKEDNNEENDVDTGSDNGIKNAVENNGFEEVDAENGVEANGTENGEELPEYQNILNPELTEEDKIKVELEILLEKKRSQLDCSPPPIPSLPVSPRALIASQYYEKLLAEPDIQQALLPHNLETNPDESFKKALLFPLLEIDPPKQCLFLLIDAIDEGLQPGQQSESRGPSRSVAELVSRHQHLLPQWLLLVCTARRGSKLTRMFTGFRKITLDELSRAHVSADVQRYVLARLDTEPKLRARVSHDGGAAAAAAAALDHLRIKSDGCLLYLEKVLDGVADGFIAWREIREIPGTLNGLYLWLAQRLFHGRRFAKVRLLLDVLLAARCGVTEEILYKCLLTKEYSVSREDFNRRLHLLRRIVVMERSTGYLQIFHHSFASWLLDVKHCTRRYLCSLAEGHAAMAMYYTLLCGRLSAMEINNYVFHMTQLEQHLSSQKKNKDVGEEVLDLHTIILLWVLDSGCDLDKALNSSDALRLDTHNQQNDTIPEENEEKDTNSECIPLERLMPELGQGERGAARVADASAIQALMRVRGDTAQTNTTTEQATSTDLVEEEPVALDPNVVFELVAREDEETLAAVLKRNPALVTAVDASGGTALHLAARAGRAACCRVLCRAGAGTTEADGDGWSPLRAAAWAGHPEVVDVLLEFGCDVDCVDGDNRTALRAAAWSGHEAVVKRLLEAGASPSLADASGRTALMAAAYMGHVDIVRALLAAGAEPDTPDSDGRTALSVACLCASGLACCALLVEKGADVNAADRDRATPLLVAANEGRDEICELLLENEADIEATDVARRTALWAAAAGGHARTVRLLLFWGACVDNMDGEGRTVLSAAAAHGNVEVVRQLLDRGLDEHHRDNSGWTPLHYAAFEGHVEVCEALLEAGATVDDADNDGKTALMLCSQEGHTRLAEILMDKWGATTDQRAHDGKTALRLAALEGHFSTVLSLFHRGADVDALDADRRSTLYVLALDNRLTTARRLIVECGASVSGTDTEGRTPLHVSAWQGHNDMVNLLIKVGGADVDGRDRCRRTALHAAAWRGREAVLRTLLEAGADPHARCTQGATPLGIAAQEGHEECVLLLLQHGADPLQADHCGRTPAKVAWRAGHAHICIMLERWTKAPPALPTAPPAPPHSNSPEHKRRSMHSSNSTKSSNLSHDPPDLTAIEQPSRANLSLSFAQQVAHVGRGRRDKERDSTILEHPVLDKADKDAKLRSYAANERDADIRGYACERDKRRDSLRGYSGYERDNMSPLYASPPHSPPSDLCSPTYPGSQPASLPAGAGAGAGAGGADNHFHRDTHMRIILGREKHTDKQDSKNKRNGIVTNPAMRLVANVRNGLDSAAANIRRTGVALAASASSANPVVKTNAFQWRKETPL